MWAKKQKNHDGLSDSKMSSFRVKFSLLIAEFSGDLCKQDCSLNGIAFIQIAPTFLMLSEFTPCPNPPQSTILCQVTMAAVSNEVFECLEPSVADLDELLESSPCTLSLRSAQ